MGDIVGTEAEELSAWNIRAWDKWYRMLAGIASRMERFQGGVIYLRIDNAETVHLSDAATALRFATQWRDHNVNLAGAVGYSVIFFRTVTTGFMVPLNGVHAMQALSETVRTLETRKVDRMLPVAIYSGLF